MAATSLREPAQQHLVAGVEEHHLDTVATAAQLGERAVPRAEVAALPRVDRDRELVAVAVVGQVVDQLPDQRDRDVVDAEELDVLERAAPCSSLRLIAR